MPKRKERVAPFQDDKGISQSSFRKFLQNKEKNETDFISKETWRHVYLWTTVHEDKKEVGQILASLQQKYQCEASLHDLAQSSVSFITFLWAC